MKKRFRALRFVLSNKRGASTVEYIIILAAGLLLAALLYGALASDEIKSVLTTAVKQAINGELSGATAPTETNTHSKAPPSTEAPTSTEATPTATEEPSFLDGITLFKRNQDPFSGIPDFVSDTVICLGGVVNCLLKDDIKEDVRDAFQDPIGYAKEVIGYDDLKDSWNKLSNINFKEQWNDLWDNPGGYLERKGDYLKEKWDQFTEDPIGNLTELGKEVVGYNDVVAWWTGKDPNTGEELRMPNRNLRLLSALPLPTKVLKLTKVADAEVVDFVHGLACAKNKNSGSSCPNNNNRDNNNTDNSNDRSPAPGSPEHKEQRWQEYLERKEREGKEPQSREQWEKNYENNKNRANVSNKKMNEYADRLGWDHIEREKNVTVEIDGKEYTRRFDIADSSESIALEHKTSTKQDGSSTTFYNDEEIRWEIERDAKLQNDEGWEIVWVFENAEPSGPLKENLKENGIRWVTVKDGETYDPKTGQTKPKRN